MINYFTTEMNYNRKFNIEKQVTREKFVSIPLTNHIEGRIAFDRPYHSVSCC